MEQTHLITEFNQHFNHPSPHIYFSPGRINLIGEHIDYNGGFVFPAAITLGTYAVVAPRDDKKVSVISGNFKDLGVIEFDLDPFEKSDDWTIYVKAVIDTFKKAGYELSSGFDAYIEGNLPDGAGLSSSASLELLISFILTDLNGLDVTMIEKAKLSQKAENQYVGVNCGIMDQFAIGMGKKDHAIKLNTGTLDYEYAKADLQDYQVLIMNTNKRRELSDSKYNERRNECDAAAQALGVGLLCEAPSWDILEGTLEKRARHAITENQRVKDAVLALENGDLVKFGQLLNESHVSLRDDYEVSGIELDTIVELAWNQEGVLGARMTGAGFGGCAIAVVKGDKIEAVKEAVGKGYLEKIGYEADFYVASIGDGTRKLV